MTENTFIWLAFLYVAVVTELSQSDSYRVCSQRCAFPWGRGLGWELQSPLVPHCAAVLSGSLSAAAGRILMGFLS